MPTQRRWAAPSRSRLTLAAMAAAGGILLAVWQTSRTVPEALRYAVRPSAVDDARRGSAKYRETDDGRQWLWASGPMELDDGEWFDVTGSPLDPSGYQYGIGKDSIPAIDNPRFVRVDDRAKLQNAGIDDRTAVIGYVNNEQAKAYPIALLDRHELVNDTVGGKPVTVGW